MTPITPKLCSYCGGTIDGDCDTQVCTCLAALDEPVAVDAAPEPTIEDLMRDAWAYGVHFDPHAVIVAYRGMGVRAQLIKDLGLMVIFHRGIPLSFDAPTVREALVGLITLLKEQTK